MSLGETLDRIVRDLGAVRGVALVGMDGIVVEERCPDAGVDLPALGAELCGLIKTVERSAQESGIGGGRELGPQELSLGFSRDRVLARRLTPEYFALLVLAGDGNYGKGRYLLRREAAALKLEL